MLWLLVLLCSDRAAAQEDDASGRLSEQGESESSAQRAEAERLREIHRAAFLRGEYQEAIRLALQEIEILADWVGEEHPAYAAGIHQLGDYHARGGAYDQALPLYLEALEIRRASLGVEHLDYAETLSSLGDLHRRMGKLSEAQRFAEESLGIQQRLLGEEHPAYAYSLVNLASLYRDMGDFEGALSRFEEGVELTRAALGEEDLEYARCLHNLSLLRQDMGDYEEALPLVQTALDIVRTQLGERHPHYATALGSLARLYQYLGTYDQAAAAFSQALTLRRELLGAEHPTYANTLMNLADLYQVMGLYDQALPLLREALDVLRPALGEQHPEYGRALIMLARLYQSMGAHEDALPHLEEATQIARDVYGEDHPNYAYSLQSLAYGYVSLGSPERALPLIRQNLSRLRGTLDEDHPSLASTLEGLAELLHPMSRESEALDHLEEAADIRRRSQGERHPDYARNLGYRAGLYEDLGQLEESLSLSQEELSILRQAFGEEHPTVSQSLSRVARLHTRSGDIQEALALYGEVMESEESNLQRYLSMGSPRQKLAYLQSMQDSSLDVYQLSLHASPTHPDTAALALETLLRRKGRAMEAEGDTLSRIRRGLDESGQAQLQALQTLNNRSDQLLRQAPSEPEQQAAWQDRVQSLRQEQEQLQKELAARALAFRELTEPATLEAVQDQLREGAGLLEWVQWTYLDPSGVSSQRYGVYLLKREGLVAWAELGEAEELRLLIDQLRRDILREGGLGFTSWGPASRRSARALYDRLLGPVERHLEGLDQLLLSPAGELFLLPFDCLLSAEGQPLGERFLVTQLSSGRDLLRLDGRPEPGSPPLVLAGIHFGGVEAPPSGADSDQKKAERSLQGVRYEPLQGTVQEGEFIQDLLWSSRLYTGSEATEARLKASLSPSILHIATHGYFMPESPAETTPGPGLRGLELASSLSPSSPLLRSGLVLAGANSGGQDEENGFLSAAELINMDLRGTELVVLSACETGVGELQIGEGVQGLSKALQVAGSETQVLSLWKVSDEATQILMQEFYSRLIDGVGRGEALRQAKATLRADPRFGHPFYWAAFVLSGDWRPLDTELGRPGLWKRWRDSRGRAALSSPQDPSLED